MTPQHRAAGTIQSDRHLFALLEELNELGRAGVTELSDGIEINKSSTHKHLKTLEEMGYVVNEDGVYRLSFKILQFGGELRDRTPICQLAREHVRELAEETNETSSFVIREQERGVFTLIHNDRYGLRETTPLGKQFDLHTNAAGKAILAALPDDEVHRILDETEMRKETEATTTSREVLFAELDRVRDQGYAVSSQERVEGVQAIAASVRDPNTGDRGALNISMPSNRLSEEGIRTRFSDAITETTDNLELQARYYPT